MKYWGMVVTGFKWLKKLMAKIEEVYKKIIS